MREMNERQALEKKLQRYEQIVGKTGAVLFGQEVFETVLKPAQERCLAGEQVSYAAWFECPACPEKLSHASC